MIKTADSSCWCRWCSMQAEFRDSGRWGWRSWRYDGGPGDETAGHGAPAVNLLASLAAQRLARGWAGDAGAGRLWWGRWRRREGSGRAAVESWLRRGAGPVREQNGGLAAPRFRSWALYGRVVAPASSRCCGHHQAAVEAPTAFTRPLDRAPSHVTGERRRPRSCARGPERCAPREASAYRSEAPGRAKSSQEGPGARARARPRA